MDYEEDPHEESQYLNLENELAEEHEYPGNGGDSDEEIFGKSNRKKGSSRQKGSKQIREPDHYMGGLGNDEDSWEADWNEWISSKWVDGRMKSFFYLTFKTTGKMKIQNEI